MSKNTINTNSSAKTNKVSPARFAAVTGMLSALAFGLQFIEFPIPIMPSFIKLDLSDLPALIGAFALGPVSGVIIELIKNLIHLSLSSSGGVGEMSNFLLGAVFVLTAGIVYKVKKNKKAALVGAIAGSCAMAIISLPINMFIVYPVYTAFMPMEAIIGAYQVITPNLNLDSLFKCLLIFNVPFTFVKGLFSVIITMLVYKPLSPLLKGYKNK